MSLAVVVPCRRKNEKTKLRKTKRKKERKKERKKNEVKI